MDVKHHVYSVLLSRPHLSPSFPSLPLTPLPPAYPAGPYSFPQRVDQFATIIPPLKKKSFLPSSSVHPVSRFGLAVRLTLRPLVNRRTSV